MARPRTPEEKLEAAVASFRILKGGVYLVTDGLVRYEHVQYPDKLPWAALEEGLVRLARACRETCVFRVSGLELEVSASPSRYLITGFVVGSPARNSGARVVRRLAQALGIEPGRGTIKFSVREALDG